MSNVEKAKSRTVEHVHDIYNIEVRVSLSLPMPAKDSFRGLITSESDFAAWVETSLAAAGGSFVGPVYIYK